MPKCEHFSVSTPSLLLFYAACVRLFYYFKSINLQKYKVHYSILNIVYNIIIKIQMSQVQTCIPASTDEPKIIELSQIQSYCKQGSEAVNINIQSIIFSISQMLKQIHQAKNTPTCVQQEKVKIEWQKPVSEKQQLQMHKALREQIQAIQFKLNTHIDRIDSQCVLLNQNLTQTADDIRRYITQQSRKLTLRLDQQKKVYQNNIKLREKQTLVLQEKTKVKQQKKDPLLNHQKISKTLFQSTDNQKTPTLVSNNNQSNKQQKQIKTQVKKEQKNVQDISKKQQLCQETFARPRKTEPLLITSVLRQQKESNKLNITNKQQKNSYQQANNESESFNKRKSSNFQDSLPTINAIDWVDSGYSHFKNLVFNKNKITPKAGEGFVFGKVRLRQRCQFNVKIDYMRKGVRLGVVDKKLKLFPVLPVNQGIIYYASDGHSWQGKQIKAKQGMRFQQGQVVSLIVDFQTNTISWKVNDQIRYSCICEQLGQQKYDWLPYIFIGVGDTVSLIQ